MREFSDEELTAYLDGETDAALSSEIENALLEQSELSQRLADLELDKDALKETFDALLTVAPEMPTPQPIATPASSFGGGFLKIAAGLVLALGVGWMLGQKDGELAEWRDYAAAYHKLYEVETLTAANFPEETLRTQFANTVKAVGADLTIEELRGFDGLELRRSQILGFDGAKIAHIALQDKNGLPFALCIIDHSDDGDLKFANDLGMETARWSKGSTSYYLIGGSDAEIIERAATYLTRL